MTLSICVFHITGNLRACSETYPKEKYVPQERGEKKKSSQQKIADLDQSYLTVVQMYPQSVTERHSVVFNCTKKKTLVQKMFFKLPTDVQAILLLLYYDKRC